MIRPVALLAFLLLMLGAACRSEQPPLNPVQTFVTVTPAPPTPTPHPLPPIDFSIYHQAMKPAFASDITELAETGITRYKITLHLRPESLTSTVGPKITGRMIVHYTNTESVLLNQVYFRLFPNTPGYGGAMMVRNVTIDEKPADIALISADSALFVPFRQALDPGDSVVITLTYEATIPTETGPGNGLYAFDEGILTLAGFYPTIPAFDHNGWHVAVAPPFADATHTDIALYDVTLTAPSELTPVTSGSIVQAIPNGDGTTTTRAVSGPMRDFYLAMSAGYQTVSREIEGVTITSHYPAGEQESGEFMLDVGATSLTIFSNLLTPYPYREFDLVAVPIPETLGGLEYPGVVALATRYYTAEIGAKDRAFIEFITAHEVAHQWWYGLVGNDQVTYPWLDEALTQYTALHYFEERYGPAKRAELVETWFSPYYWQLQDQGTNRSVFGAAGGFSDASYFPVVYGKGPLFFDALRDQVGNEAYFAGLRHYAAQYRYGIVTPGNLLNTFGGGGNRSVEELYRQWILEP